MKRDGEIIGKSIKFLYRITKPTSPINIVLNKNLLIWEHNDNCLPKIYKIECNNHYQEKFVLFSNESYIDLDQILIQCSVFLFLKRFLFVFI